jgi:hypothetical protein
MLDRLREIIAHRREEWGGELIECNGEPDRVPILAALPPSLDLWLPQHP